MLRTYSTPTSSGHQNCSSNLKEEEKSVTSGVEAKGVQLVLVISLLTSSTYSCFCVLEEPTVLQVVFDDDVGDGVENELHVLRICGTGEVRVNLLGFFLLVQVLKLGADVLGGFVVVVGTLLREDIQSTMRKQQERMNTERWQISDRQEARKINLRKRENSTFIMIIKVTHDLFQLTDISKAACPVLD